MTEDTPVVLALDQGGHASRACILDATGTTLAETSIPIGTSHGSAGEVEHDPDELVESLWRASQGAMHSAMQTARREGMGLLIQAAGLATQRSTIVCFDARNGAALSPAISWQDRRNADWLASFAAHGERIRQITGLPLSPHYGVAKMRWCLDHLPAVRAARSAGTLQIAPLAAYLAARLTGGPARVDPANASRTLLWDSARLDWSDELLQLFAIDRNWLPPCTSTRADYGALRGPAPLPATPLCAVSGDQSAIPFAFGAPDPHTVYINLGTGAFLQRPVSSRPLDPSPLLASVLAVERQQACYCLEGTVNGAGSAISAFLAQERLDESALWRELEQLPASARLPIYVNGIGGLGSPYWRATQRSYFIGDGSVIERFAAVLESIAFLIAINFERMRGGEAERVIVSGGLSRCDWLCRRVAVLLGVPLLRAAQEATVLGIAALSAPQLFLWRRCGEGSGGELEPGAARALAHSRLQRFEARDCSGRELQRLRARRARFETCLNAGSDA